MKSNKDIWLRWIISKLKCEKAKDLSDAEIIRAFKNTGSASRLIKYAQEFRDSEELTIKDIW